jgi:hypothetical protein
MKVKFIITNINVFEPLVMEGESPALRLQSLAIRLQFPAIGLESLEISFQSPAREVQSLAIGLQSPAIRLESLAIEARIRENGAKSPDLIHFRRILWVQTGSAVAIT